MGNFSWFSFSRLLLDYFSRLLKDSYVENASQWIILNPVMIPPRIRRRHYNTKLAETDPPPKNNRINDLELSFKYLALNH